MLLYGSKKGHLADHEDKDKSRSKTGTLSSNPNRSSSAVSNIPEGFEAPPNDDFYFRNNHQKMGWSPTPSVRGRKARAFIEQHGSPPGIRVTAGGKIVQDGPYNGPYSPPGVQKTVPVCNPAALGSHELNALQGCIVNVGEWSPLLFRDAETRADTC